MEAGTDLRVPYRLTYRDWLHARRILRRREKIHYLYDFGLQAGVTVAALFLLWIEPIGMKSITLSVGEIVLVFFFIWFITRMGWVNREKNLKKDAVQLAIIFQQEALALEVVSSAGTSVSTVKWDVIHGFEEDQQVFFFLTKGSMLYLPKRDTPQELFPTIREIAKDKVKSK